MDLDRHVFDGLMLHHYYIVSGLLCLRTAKSGGKSELASSITIYNELLKRDPKIIEILVSTTHDSPKS